MYDALSGCELIAEYSPPLPSGHAGIGTSMSRGNETTVMRRGSSLMCTSMVTSLRSPGESSFAHRGNRATSCPSQESDPTMRTLTPPSISPIDGGRAASPSSSTEFSPRAENVSQTAKAATPAALTPRTASTTATTDSARISGRRSRRTAWRATGCHPSGRGRLVGSHRGVSRKGFRPSRWTARRSCRRSSRAGRSESRPAASVRSRSRPRDPASPARWARDRR